MKSNLFKSTLLFLAVLALLATTGCIIPVDDGGGRGHGGYSDRGDHWDHHDNDHHDDDHR